MSTVLTLENAVNLIWREADMLDRRDYDAWLDLWHDDGLYIVPIDQSADDYADVLNYAYDDAEMRRKRVVRLKSAFSMSALTAAETVRTVSRFVTVEADSEAMTLRAAQQLVAYRRDQSRTIAANLDVKIVSTPGGLKLARKVVRLVNSEDAVSSMGYLL